MNAELRKIYQHLPSGTSLPYDRFSQLVQHPLLSTLPYGANDVISRNRNRITIQSPGGLKHRVDKANLEFDRLVEFDFNPSSTDIEMKNITGIKLSAGRSARMTVAELLLSRLADGNLKLVARLQVHILLPYLTMELTITPDGKPV